MNITAAKVFPYSLPLLGHLHTGAVTISERLGFILRLRTEDGSEGYGEASPAYWLGSESLERTRGGLADLEKALERGRPLPHHMEPSVRAAVETALFDIEARSMGVPLAELLSDAPAASLPLAALIGVGDGGDVGKHARAAVEQGYPCVKLKVATLSLEDDRRRLAAVRNAAGWEVELRLDANGAWNYEQARSALELFSKYEVSFVEEPLAGSRPEELALLRREQPVAVAVDESLVTVGDLDRVIVARAADVVVIKSARVGGSTAAVELGRRASRQGLKVVVTDSIESPVGMAAALHVAAALGPRPAAVGLGGSQTLAADGWEGLPFLGRGRATLPGPGLGVRPHV